MSTLLIEAGPGTGKTSTLLSAINRTFKGEEPGFTPSEEQQAIYEWLGENCPDAVKEEEIVFLAYNKSIATELQDSISYGQASTLHSLGAKLCLQNMGGKPKLNKYRTSNIVQQAMGVKKWKDLSEDQRVILKETTELVSAAKDQAMGPENISPATINQLISLREMGNTECSASVLSKYTKLVLQRCLEEHHEYDYDDMIYLPVMNGWHRKFTVMLIDECQDLSPGRLRFILNQDAEVRVFVGDPNQAIYAFAGADADSIEKIKSKTEADVLPLSVTWRCPKSVVELAKRSQTYGTLSAPDSASNGTIQEISLDTLDKSLADNPSSLILCRTNAPLIKVAWQALRAGTPVRLLGRSLEAGVSTLIRNKSEADWNSLPVTATERVEKEIAKIQKRPYNTEMQVAALQDKLACFLFLYEQSDTLADFKNNIRKLFRAKSPLIGCTIHKAKGLEAETVFWLYPEDCPHPMAKSSTAKAQETNLRFVATTRTKENLFFIPKPKQDA